MGIAVDRDLFAPPRHSLFNCFLRIVLAVFARPPSPVPSQHFMSGSIFDYPGLGDWYIARSERGEYTNISIAIPDAKDVWTR